MRNFSGASSRYTKPRSSSRSGNRRSIVPILAILAGLVLFTAAEAADLPALRTLVTRAPYGAMTSDQAFAALTAPTTRKAEWCEVTARELYERLTLAEAEQWLALLESLTRPETFKDSTGKLDPAGFAYWSPTAGRFLQWMGTNGGGLDVNAAAIGKWLDRLSRAVPGIKATNDKIRAFCDYPSTVARDLGYWDAFTAADVAAARALP